MSDKNEVISAKEGIISLIPEIYFDIISRIVPGIIFITLYKFELTLNSIATISLAITYAYFIGITLSVLSIGVPDYFSRPKKPKSKTFKSLIFGEGDSEIWNYLRSKSLAKQGLYIKMLAEKGLFRNMAVISIIIALNPPAVFGHQIHRSIGILGAIICRFCLGTTHSWIIENMNQSKKTEASAPEQSA